MAQIEGDGGVQVRHLLPVGLIGLRRCFLCPPLRGVSYHGVGGVEVGRFHGLAARVEYRGSNGVSEAWVHPWRRRERRHGRHVGG